MKFGDALKRRDLFGNDIGDPTWIAHHALLKVAFGEGADLSPPESKIFTEITGLETPPTEPSKELWLLGGRRGGKSASISSAAVYLATIGADVLGFTKQAKKHGRLYIGIIAVDKAQASIILEYIKQYFDRPPFDQLVERSTRTEIDLTNGISIVVFASQQARLRGRGFAAILIDEVAWLIDDQDRQNATSLLKAVRPGMLTVPNSILIAISSPAGKTGVVFDTYKRHFKNYDPKSKILVAQAPTWVLNKTISEDDPQISEAYRDDPQMAACEYGAEFMDGVSSIFGREAIEKVTGDYDHQPPTPNRSYRFAIDAAGGSGQDSFAASILHVERNKNSKEPDRVVVDLLMRFNPPFDPDQVVRDIVDTFEEYCLSSPASERAVIGDRYASAWVNARFKESGWRFKTSKVVTSDALGHLVPVVNSGSIVLPRDRILVNELVGLQRTMGGARPRISHGRFGHDDVASALAHNVYAATINKRRKEPCSYTEGDAPPMQIIKFGRRNDSPTINSSFETDTDYSAVFKSLSINSTKEF